MFATRKDQKSQFVGAPLITPVTTGFTYSQNKTWVTSNGTWSVPDQVTVFSASSSGAKSFTYQKVAAYFDQVVADYGLSLDYVWHHIPVGVSAFFSNIDASLRLYGGTFTFTKEEINLYSLRTMPDLSLDPDFVAAVQKLASSPSDAKYQEFIDKYGTHAQAGLDMGGFLWTGGAVSPSDMVGHSSTTAGVSGHLAMINLKLGSTANPYSGLNRNVKPKWDSILRSLRVGGDTVFWLGSDRSYSKWVESIPDSPARIGYQIGRAHV